MKKYKWCVGYYFEKMAIHDKFQIKPRNLSISHQYFLEFHTKELKFSPCETVFSIFLTLQINTVTLNKFALLGKCNGNLVTLYNVMNINNRKLRNGWVHNVSENYL